MAGVSSLFVSVCCFLISHNVPCLMFSFNLYSCSIAFLMVLQTLYTFPDNFRAYKILIAAEYSEVKVKCVCDPPEFIMGKTNKSDEFLSKFPLGKVCVCVCVCVCV